MRRRSTWVRKLPELLGLLVAQSNRNERKLTQLQVLRGDASWPLLHFRTAAESKNRRLSPPVLRENPIDYEVVPVVAVDVEELVGVLLTVGPPALPADAAIPMPAPAKATTLRIMVVLRSQSWAARTPAGLPGGRAEESAKALEAQSASDIEKQMTFFISITPWTN